MLAAWQLLTAHECRTAFACTALPFFSLFKAVLAGLSLAHLQCTGPANGALLAPSPCAALHNGTCIKGHDNPRSPARGTCRRAVFLYHTRFSHAANSALCPDPPPWAELRSDAQGRKCDAMLCMCHQGFLPFHLLQRSDSRGAANGMQLLCPTLLV